MKAQFSNSFSTNLLFLAILGLSPYTRWARSSNQVLTIGAVCVEEYLSVSELNIQPWQVQIYDRQNPYDPNVKILLSTSSEEGIGRGVRILSSLVGVSPGIRAISLVRMIPEPYN